MWKKGFIKEVKLSEDGDFIGGIDETTTRKTKDEVVYVVWRAKVFEVAIEGTEVKV